MRSDEHPAEHEHPAHPAHEGRSPAHPHCRHHHDQSDRHSGPPHDEGHRHDRGHRFGQHGGPDDGHDRGHDRGHGLGHGHGSSDHPTLESRIVTSANRIRRSGLTPGQLQHRIAATVSHADYVTTMRTLGRIGADLRRAR